MNKPELPGYDLLEHLPSGGVWNVFKARQLSLNRMVIVKFLSTSLLEDEDDSKSFIFETRRVALIKHPNIVQIYDFGKTSDNYFSVVEFVDGYSLATWLNKTKALPSHTALLVAEGVAKALSYAWDKAGATHGALKPNNILVDADGTIKVTDFGLSATMRLIRKKGAHDSAHSRPLLLNYTAPEQRTGPGDADCRVDLYALGALLYHMSCGKMPAPETAEPLAHFGPDARAVKPELPMEVVRLIQKLMAPDREHRPKDWGETLQDIIRVKSGNSPSGNFPADTIQPAASSSIVPPKRRTVSVIVKTEAPPKAAAAKAAAFAQIALKIAALILKGLGRLWARLLQQRSLQGFLIAAATLIIVILLFFPHIKEFLTVQSQPDTDNSQSSPASAQTDSRPPAPASNKQTPAPAQATALPENAFSEALAWARNNPDKMQEAISKFDDLAKRTPPTRTSELAAGEAQRLRTQMAQEVVAELRVQAQTLAAKGHFAEAADLCINYQGPLAEATATARTQLADTFREEAKTLEENRKKAAEQAEKKFNDAIVSAVALLMTDKNHEALKVVEQAGAMPGTERLRLDIQAFASAISAAAGMETTVLRSFQNTCNRQTTVSLLKGQESLIITNITDTELQGMQITRLGDGEIRKPRNIAFKELALTEIIDRVSKAHPVHSFLLSGLVCYKAGNITQAGTYFEKTGPLLAPVLSDYLKTLESKRLESEAEETLVKILKAINITLEEGPFSTHEALNALNKRKFNPREAGTLAKYAETYRNRYGQTMFAKKAEPVINAISDINKIQENPAPDSTPAPDEKSAQNSTQRFEATIEETPADISESFQNRFTDLNPGITRWQINMESDESGIVTALEIRSSRLKDLAPLAAFSNLTRLVASGTGNDDLLGMVVPAPLKDLSPIAGCPIQDLNIGYTRIKDLSPLKGMPINNLNIQFTLVEDISSLKGMPLNSLNMDGTDVRNFEPLSGAPLHQLSLNRALILDVSPLKNLPLTSLQLRRTRITYINGLQGMRLTHLDLSHTKIQNLGPLRGMPLQQLIIEGVPVSDLSPLAGMQLTELFAGSSEVKDLSALRGMPLTTLNLEFTSVSDLSPIAGLPLETLNLRNTKVRDLGPLRGMPLRRLDIRQTDIKTLAPIRNLPIEELFLDKPENFKQDLDDMTQIKQLNEKSE